jgi:hypothetical protein
MPKEVRIYHIHILKREASSREKVIRLLSWSHCRYAPRLIDERVEFGYEALEDELDSAVAGSSSQQSSHMVRTYARVGRKFYQLEYIRGNDLCTVGVLANCQ